MPSDALSVCDFARSFVMFRIDMRKKPPKTVSQPPPFTLNNARLQLECRCRVRWPEKQNESEYVLSSSCKAEQVNVPENIWHDPPADMCIAASADEFLVMKSWDRNNRGVMLSPPSLGPQPERQAGRNEEAFDRFQIDVRETAGTLLGATGEIVAAGLENRPVVSHTEFTTPEGAKVWLEYPIKVINISERDQFYQVDTGPVLIPDAASVDGAHAISALRLAFVAHNSLGCTEFLVNVPTPIGGGMSVNHYSRVVKVKATNRMIAM